MYELENPAFVDVIPTVEFLTCFDKIFDIMNSRNLKQHRSKAPLQKSNENEWRSCFEETVTYICNLKMKAGKPVLKS